MLKFQSLITTGVASLLVVPAVTLGNDDLKSLESALENTSRALEVLKTLGAQAEAKVAGSVDRVLSVTEPPTFEGPAQDALLETLRHEVSLLQVEFDLLETRSLDTDAVVTTGPPSALAVASGGSTGGPTTTDPGRSRPAITTGLSPAQLESLRGTTLPPSAGNGAGGGATARKTGSGPEAHPVQLHALGRQGYSADPIRHARTLFRAGRYLEGHDLIETLTDPDARYLKARLLEKLGRIDEAIDTLRAVMDDLPEGYEAQRAKSDLEFFEWKQEFLRKLPAKATTSIDRGDAKR